jgi:hypothetical protein
MAGRVYAGELVGPGWDAVRARRQQIIGNRGETLDATVVPAEYHDLLPFASLLSTGEEPLAEDFWIALSPEDRQQFMSKLSPERADKIQEWARNAGRSTERWAFFYLAENYRSFVGLPRKRPVVPHS